jgi:hypothetical protein
LNLPENAKLRGDFWSLPEWFGESIPATGYVRINEDKRVNAQEGTVCHFRKCFWVKFKPLMQHAKRTSFAQKPTPSEEVRKRLIQCYIHSFGPRYLFRDIRKANTSRNSRIRI